MIDDPEIKIELEEEDVGNIKGTLFERDGGIVYFPAGVDAFCDVHNIEVLTIDDQGAMYVVEHGGAKWQEFPFPKKSPSVVSLKS